MKAWFSWILAIACFCVAGSSVQEVRAEEKTVIRYATLAPSQSAFGKILKAWGRSLKKETEGRVEFRVYSGGSQGDERDESTAGSHRFLLGGSCPPRGS